MSDDNKRRDDDASAEPEPKIFAATITPHRSLGSTGFLILMLGIGGVSFVSGMVFLLLGAWPVFGFLGLDVLLIYWAFRANFRAARAYEEVTVTASELTVRKVSQQGSGANGRSTRSGCSSTASSTRNSVSSGCFWCRAAGGCRLPPSWRPTRRQASRGRFRRRWARPSVDRPGIKRAT